MTEFVRINRRLFLARLGKGTMALAVLGACGPDTGGSSTTAYDRPGSTVRDHHLSRYASTTTTGHHDSSDRPR